MSPRSERAGPVNAGPYGELIPTTVRVLTWNDYILVGRPRRGGAGHVVGCALAGVEPVDGVVPSDHYAVVADLRY